jgi:hypothetical protein
VYTLEKVLKMKKDTVSGINFLDEAMKARTFYFDWCLSDYLITLMVLLSLALREQTEHDVLVCT